MTLPPGMFAISLSVVASVDTSNETIHEIFIDKLRDLAAFDRVCDERRKAHLEASRLPTPISEGTERPVPCRRPTAPRTFDEWHEEHGDVVWWCWRDGEWLGEPAYIGTPLDLGRGYELAIGDHSFVVHLGGWPGYHTHWTPHPFRPAAPEHESSQQ